jgi:DNA-binding NarL/FixJ family response regulator
MGLDVVSTTTLEEALALVERHGAAFVVIASRAHRPEVLEVLARIRSASPNARIACFAPDDRRGAACVEAGADLVLSKQQSLEELINTVLGWSPSVKLSPHEIRAPVVRRSGEYPLAAQFLTNRERDVLRLLVAAESTETIAKQLGITVATARGYIQSTFSKLGVHSRVEVVTYAVANSMVEF